MREAVLLALVLVLLGVAGCEKTDGKGGSFDADGPISDACGTIQDVFRTYSCTSCHNATPAVTGGGLDLQSDGLADRLVGQPSRNPRCGGELLVDPEAPEASLLLRVVAPARFGQDDAGACDANQMPLGAAADASLAVSEADVACIEQWVRGLAASYEPPAEEAVPFDPAPAESAVAKVKYLLHGGAPTDDELNAARAADGGLDRDALRSLIDGWIWEDEGKLAEGFERKLRGLLSLTLQQRPSPVANNLRYRAQLRPTTGGGNPTQIDRAQLFRTIPQVFVDTATDIVGRDGDFREVLTTRRWRVTTAILAALVYADRSDLVNARGRIPVQNRFGNFAHLQASDYEDWRYVRFRQATDGAPPDLRYENTAEFAAAARAVQAEDTVRLAAPRVGFFNTLEFFDNWVTNVDNQFRVTTSQAVIAALDLEFEASDSTDQPSLLGVDTEHAREGTACYACHRLMDPMRNVFERYYTLSHNQARPQPTGDDGSFAFHGHVVSPVRTMEEFAEALATHPRLPIAWAQKLCMWANAARCEESDPELVAVAERFASGYDEASSDDDFRLSTLIRELFSSPLITGAALARTHERQLFFVSTTRYRHFCQAMDARMQQAAAERCEAGGDPSAEICQPLPLACALRGVNSRALALGQDAYNRGSRNLTTPSTADPFQAVSVQEVCRQLAIRTVGAAPFSGAAEDEDTTIDRFVRIVMGLPTTHSRYGQAAAALRRAYRLLRARPVCSAEQDLVEANAGVEADGEPVCGLGLGPTGALRAAFTIACSAPDVIGMGL